LYITPLAKFFLFTPLSLHQILPCIAIGLLSVIWYELVKWRKRKLYSKNSIMDSGIKNSPLG
jgi:P-type Ca2+ transporter type 2C